MSKPLAWGSLAAAFVVLLSASCGGSVIAESDSTDGGTSASGSGGSAGGATGSGGTGGGADFGSCSRNSDCMVRAKSCCGACGVATRQDFVTINGASASAYADIVCSGGMGCPACYMAGDPNLLATCNGSRCALVDLLAEALTACTTGSDCRVRTNECCECNGKVDREHLIAVANSWEETFHKLFCDSDSVCGKCVPIYPPEATAACDNNHCIVKYSN